MLWLIFYNIDDEFNLKPEFDYIHCIKNRAISKLKIFKQDDKYCYILFHNVLMIIKIDDKKKVECLFRSYLGREIVNNICPIKRGLLFGWNNYPYINYLMEINGNFEIIDNAIFLRDNIIYDIIKDNNQLFIVTNKEILAIKNS